MIEPALTPEEWANGRVEFKSRSQWDSYGLELPRGRPGNHHGPGWEDKEDAALIVFDGSWSAPISERHRMAAAALCLHGRITWEMVDALRRSAREATDASRGIAFTGDPATDSPYLRDTLTAVADLLESLLRPREP